MPSAFSPMSFLSSACHHGLKTAPGGESFSSVRKLPIAWTDISQAPISKPQGSSDHQAPKRNARNLSIGAWNFSGVWDLGFTLLHAFVSLRRRDDRPRHRSGITASVESRFVRTVHSRRARIC